MPTLREMLDEYNQEYFDADLQNKMKIPTRALITIGDLQ